MAALDVDDRQPARTEPHLAVHVIAVVVRPAVHERVGHPLQRRTIDGLVPRARDDPADAAHLRSPLPTSRFATRHALPASARKYSVTERSAMYSKS